MLEGNHIVAIYVALVLAVSTCVLLRFFSHHATIDKRTVRLLLLPAVTFVTAVSMTYFNYETIGYYKNVKEYAKWEMGASEEDLAMVVHHGDFYIWSTDRTFRAYQLSQCINFWGPESWSAWVARWSMWHLTILLMVEFKCEVLPREVVHVPILWGLGLLFAMWSGLKQVDGLGYGPQNATPEGYGPGWMPWCIGHSTSAVIAFFLSWYEAVMIWWPSRALHVCYALLVCYFLYTQSLGADSNAGNDYDEYVTQWAVVLMNLIVTWANVPRVQKEIEQGTWRPWAGGFRWCCGSLPVLEGSCCCPPAGATERGKLAVAV